MAKTKTFPCTQAEDDSLIVETDVDGDIAVKLTGCYYGAHYLTPSNAIEAGIALIKHGKDALNG